MQSPEGRSMAIRGHVHVGVHVDDPSSDAGMGGVRSNYVADVGHHDGRRTTKCQIMPAVCGSSFCDGPTTMCTMEQFAEYTAVNNITVASIACRTIDIDTCWLLLKKCRMINTNG